MSGKKKSLTYQLSFIYSEIQRVEGILEVLKAAALPELSTTIQQMAILPTLGEIRNLPIWRLGANGDASLRLQRAGIDTIGKLMNLSYAELQALPGIGKQTAWSIHEALQVRGLTLMGD